MHPPSSAYIPPCWVGLLGEVHHCVSAHWETGIPVDNVLKKANITFHSGEGWDIYWKTVILLMNSKYWRLYLQINLWYGIVNDSCHNIQHVVILNWGSKIVTIALILWRSEEVHNMCNIIREGKRLSNWVHFWGIFYFFKK